MIPELLFENSFWHILMSTLRKDPIWWKDPERPVWYETSDGGESLLIGEAPPPSTAFQKSEKQGWPLEDGLRLVHSLFADPRRWWQQIREHEILPCFFHQGYLLLGPALKLSGHICPTCLALRLAQSFPRPDLFKSFLVTEPHTSAALLDLLHSQFEMKTFRDFIKSRRTRFLDGELLSFPIAKPSPEGDWHQLLPPPGMHPWHQATESAAKIFGIPQICWPAPNPEHALLPRAEIIDPLLGPLIATSVLEASADEPSALRGSVTITGSLREYVCWKPDISGSGCNFAPGSAVDASVGEAVERYCGNHASPTLPWYTEQELERQNCPYVSPALFYPWAKDQTTSASWPFTPRSAEDALPWVEATTLAPHTQKGILLPAEVVYLSLPRVTGQAIFPVTLAGIAAHRNRKQAEEAALLELVERDATMLYWHAGTPAQRLCDLPDALCSTLESGAASWIQQWYLLLTTDIPIPVVGACLYDQRNQILSVGFAARLDLAEAIRKAAAEAWQLRRLSVDLLEPTSALWQGINDGNVPIPTIRFRPDRQYTKGFQRDFSDMYQLAFNLQYYLDPATHPYALERLSGQDIGYDQAQTQWQGQPASVLARCLPWLMEKEQELYSVDLTTPDMRACGFVVVRVMCPGLVGNAATAFLPLAHPRLQAAIHPGCGISCVPMPHA